AARELLDLIDRDRPAAALALGMPAALGASGPGATQPVAAVQGNARGELAPAQTTRLRATPSPSQPVLPTTRAAPPPGLPTSPVHAARSSAPQATSVVPPGPVVFSPPRRADAAQASPAGGDHETAIQTPLGWPPTTTRRRRLHLVAGAVACAVVGVVA